MSKDPLYEHLRETSWRRKLTAEEEARLAEWLAAHPEELAEWDMEAQLNTILERLPNAPVANNFTARVLNEAKRQAASAEQAASAASSGAWWLRWIPRAGIAAAVLAAGLLSYHHIQESKRQEVAESLSAISAIPSVSPEALKDFDAIAALSSNPPADEELLKVMQ